MYDQEQYKINSDSAIRPSETSRIKALKNYRILDTLEEEEFNSITKIIAQICNVPISLITFIDKDRQWFKSTHGVGELKETTLEASFCSHTIREVKDHMVINDLSQDTRFEANPFVTGEPHVKFYAGVSLITPNGHRLGTVCVLDDKPRELTQEQFESLELMSKYTMRLLELKKQNEALKVAQNSLNSLNQSLEQFTYSIAHDIKSPLRIMSGFTHFLMRDKTKNKLNETEQEYLDFIVSSANELSNYTNNLLRFAQNTQMNTVDCTEVDLTKLCRSIANLVNLNNEVVFLTDDLPTIYTSEVGLKQILQNLISNSIRYRNPNVATPYVAVELETLPNHYQFKVIDNGKGISATQKEAIFELFKKNKLNRESTGIGLNVVKRIVEKMNGTMSVDSEEGKGTTVTFTIERVL